MATIQLINKVSDTLFATLPSISGKPYATVDTPFSRTPGGYIAQAERLADDGLTSTQLGEMNIENIQTEAQKTLDSLQLTAEQNIAKSKSIAAGSGIQVSSSNIQRHIRTLSESYQKEMDFVTMAANSQSEIAALESVITQEQIDTDAERFAITNQMTLDQADAAADQADAAAEQSKKNSTMSGMATGATVGFQVGGPVGAVIGGIGGAIFGGLF